MFRRDRRYTSPRSESAPVLLRVASPLILWVSIFVGAPGFVMSLSHSHRAEQEDFAVYYLQGQALREHANPYEADFAISGRRNSLNTHGVTHGSDPPTFLIICRLLAGLPLHMAYWLWQGTNLICLALVLFLLLGPDSGVEPPWALTLAGLAVLYPPIIVHFWFAQSKLPLVLLLALMARWMGRQRDRLAGCSLAVAVLLRVFPLVIAGYLVLQQRRRTFAYLIAGFLAGALFTVVFIGWNNCLGFFTSLRFLTGNPWKRDISVYLFVRRWTWAVYPHATSGIAVSRYALVAAIDLLLLVAAVRATLRFAIREDPEGCLFALWIATAIMLQPVAWDYDLTLLLIPFGQMASAAARRRVSGRTLAMALASYLLIWCWEVGAAASAPGIGSFTSICLSESGLLAMVAAWVSTYWFAIDQAQGKATALGALPGEVWRRLTMTGAFSCAPCEMSMGARERR
jgi:hypothetical protein